MTDLEIAGQNLDRICTIEMRMQGMIRGIVEPLYTAAREKQGKPITLASAEHLTKAVKEGDVVVIGTGVYNALHFPKGELDGPIGAAALARFLALTMNAKPLILCEDELIHMMERTIEASGVRAYKEREFKEFSLGCCVRGFTKSNSEAPTASREILDRWNPSAIITIEKIGPNKKGVFHSATGRAIPDEQAKINVLVDAARQDKILTIGIGDNGNEIGYGLIEDAVRKYTKYGEKCRCPCGAGNACVTSVDIMFAANTSNWGAYGIEACLATLLRKPEDFHDSLLETRMIKAAVDAGALDGSTGLPTLGNDGTPLQAQTAVVDLMQIVIKNHFKVRRRADESK